MNGFMKCIISFCDPLFVIQSGIFGLCTWMMIKNNVMCDWAVFAMLNLPSICGVLGIGTS